MFNTARRFLRLRQANGYCHGPYSSSEVWQIIRYNEGMIGYRGLFYDEDRPRTREGDDPMGRGTPYTWVLEDLTGEPVSYEQVMPPRRKRPKGRFSGRRRPHYHCLLRYPRTRRVLRDGAFPDPEGAPRLRGRQRKLPTAWDDLYRRHQRSWKRHRKTQYHHKA